MWRILSNLYEIAGDVAMLLNWHRNHFHMSENRECHHHKIKKKSRAGSNGFRIGNFIHPKNLHFIYRLQHHHRHHHYHFRIYGNVKIKLKN